MLDILNDLFEKAVARGASDLHLTAEQPPIVRIGGQLRKLEESSIDTDILFGIVHSLTSEHQQHEYQRHHSVDIGYTTPGKYRFRINIYQELGRPVIAARYLDQNMLSLSELGLPPVVGTLAGLKSGLVLVTGATGSGKSTTLATLVNEINSQRTCHILTIEDPVEFVHQSKKSLIHHRELYTDVPSFAEAVRASLREDPDVIMVGEMRDLDTVRAVLTAAETGHLVLSTLHTGDAIGSVERLVGSFPGHEQGAARHRIAMVLKAVVSQHLLPIKGKTDVRLAAIEVLIVNQAVSNLIETAKTRQIYSVMETGSSYGMQTLDQSLAAWVGSGKLDMSQARMVCSNPKTLERLARGVA